MDSDRLSALPQAFLHRMEDMLGDDFEPFLAAYEQPAYLWAPGKHGQRFPVRSLNRSCPLK